MPESPVRISWTSSRAQEYWAPKIRNALICWSSLEWRSVQAGIRYCALTTIAQAKIAEFVDSFLPSELAVIRLSTPEDTTSSAMLIARPEAAKPFVRAWHHQDVAAMGDLLGYPGCCVRNYCEWSALPDTDLLPRLVRGSNSDDAEVSSFYSTPLLNPLLRKIGLYATPHLPCSIHCQPSRKLADSLLALSDSGEMDTLLNVLDWPLEWTGMHGIAELKSPVFKVCMRTDHTRHKRSFRWLGRTIPMHAGKGLAFPFTSHERATVTASPSFARGLVHIAGLTPS
jgi:hypothetical protein